jgi:hypothetical protein
MLIRSNTSLLLLHERPRFIDLNLSSANVSELAIKNAFRFLTSNAKDFKNGFRVDLIKSRRCSNSASFSQARQNAIDRLFGKVKRLADFLRLRECLAATRALKARCILFAEVAVNVWFAVASLWASLHGFLSSFLTRITVRNTIRLRALSGIYGVSQVKRLRGASNTPSVSRLVRPSRLELEAPSLVGRCSIHLSLIQSIYLMFWKPNKVVQLNHNVDKHY